MAVHCDNRPRDEYFVAPAIVYFVEISWCYLYFFHTGDIRK